MKTWVIVLIVFIILAIIAGVIVAVVYWKRRRPPSPPSPPPPPPPEKYTCPTSCGDPKQYPQCVDKFIACVNSTPDAPFSVLNACGNKAVICFGNNGVWNEGSDDRAYKDNCNPYRDDFPVKGCNYTSLYNNRSYDGPQILFDPNKNYKIKISGGKSGQNLFLASSTNNCSTTNLIMNVDTSLSQWKFVPILGTNNQFNIFSVSAFAPGSDVFTCFVGTPADCSTVDLALLGGLYTWEFVPVSGNIYNIKSILSTCSSKPYLSTTSGDNQIVNLSPTDDQSGLQRWEIIPDT
jgi:hypothetical protein